MASNPNPARVTDALWYFGQQCLALQPGTENGGTYAPKYEYHDTRDHIVANKGVNGDYSVRLAADKLGPGDKCAAFDWTFPDAQNGRYATITTYGWRIKVAFSARDPRLSGWREVLIQADTDSNAEGFDFVGWFERTPDSSHLWHGHFSCLRQYVNDFTVMNGMLSILAGESLETWRTGRSRYGGTAVEDDVNEDQDRRLFNTEELKVDAILTLAPEYSYVPWGGSPNDPVGTRKRVPNELAKAIKALQVDVAAVKAALGEAAEIELPPDFVDRVVAKVAEGLGTTVEAAVERQLERLTLRAEVED